MLNLGGFGALGFGFTMNLGANRDRGPNFQMGFNFIPLFIGFIIILITSLGDFIPSFIWSSDYHGTTTNNINSRISSRGQSSSGYRSRTNPRQQVINQQNLETGIFEYFF